MNLPQDNFMLLSVINTKLRDKYNSLDALCEDIGADKGDIIARLSGIGYDYNESLNQFK